MCLCPIRSLLSRYFKDNVAVNRQTKLAYGRSVHVVKERETKGTRKKWGNQLSSVAIFSGIVGLSVNVLPCSKQLSFKSYSYIITIFLVPLIFLKETSFTSIRYSPKYLRVRCVITNSRWLSWQHLFHNPLHSCDLLVRNIVTVGSNLRGYKKCHSNAIGK